jgi:hypothetical protein
MIQAFQKFSQSRVAKIFLAIVALSFIVFGGSSMFRSHDPNAVVAQVGDVAISRYELVEKVQRYSQRIAAQTGESLTREQLLEAGIPYMILQSLVQDLYLDLEAKHLGITVSDDVLRDRIHGMEVFHNEKGEFDRTYFTQLLQSNGLSEEKFLEEIKLELTREQLSNAIKVGAYLPDIMVDKLFDAQYQQRQASMLVVADKDIPAPPAPDQKTLEAFYNDHQQAFKTPELRTATLLVLDPTALGADIAVTDEELKATYDAKAGSLGNKPFEEVKAQLLKDLQKEKSTEKIYKITQELDDKIAGGATFEELAPTVPGAQLVKFTEIDQQGDDWMGAPSPQLPQDKAFGHELLTAIFQLDEGGDSPFAQAQNGAYFTARVDKITPTTLRPFAELQSLVLSKWQTTEKAKAAYAKAEKYTKDFNQGNRKAALMTLLPNVSLAEKSPNVSDAVKNLIYSLQVGHAGMTRIPEGFAVVVLNKIIPPQEKIKQEKMAEFKETVLKGYQNDLVASYIKALEKRYPLHTHLHVVKALFSQS